MKRIASIIALAMLMTVGNVAGQMRYEIAPESKLWISGSSNVNRFTCEAEDSDGHGLLPALDENARVRSAALPLNSPVVEVTIPVERFDCGKRRMNEDFFEALRADQYPEITFTLQNAQVLGEANVDEGGWVRIKATGELSIAGNSKSVTIELIGKSMPDGRLRARGNAPLLMSDFGIEPPTAMLGLVRARDAIEVHFDLTADNHTSGR